MKFRRTNMIKGLAMQREDERLRTRKEMEKVRGELDALRQQYDEDLSILKSACDDISGLIENGDILENDFYIRFKSAEKSPFGREFSRWLCDQEPSIINRLRKMNALEEQVSETYKKSQVELFLESREEEEISDYSMEKAGFPGFKWGYIVAAAMEA